MASEALIFSGRVSYEPDDAGLTYREEGLLRPPGRPAMQAERRYLWRASGDDIEVRFEDERFFHTIPKGVYATATHDCVPDRYNVIYDFRSWPQWHSVWEVSGPRKDYRMLSMYRPERQSRWL